MRANLNRVFQVAIACVLAVGIWTPALALPISEGFEDGGDFPIGTLGEGQHGNVTVTGSVAVVDDDAIEGSKSLVLGAEEFTQGAVSMIASGDPENVWAVVYTIPGRSDDSYFGALEDDTAFAFGVDTNGSVHAFSIDDWVVEEVAIASNDWVGFVIHADYSTKTYDLYMTTNGHLAYKHRIFEGLGFNTAYTNTSMSELRVETSVLKTYVDALTMQASLVGDNLMISPRASGASVPPPPYAYTGAEKQFDGLLGDDMKAGLVDGDEVRVFVDGAWYQYELTGGTWDGAAFPEVDLLNYINWVAVATPGVALYEFVTFPEAPTAKLTGSDTWAGWNHLQWPDEEKTADQSSQWGFTGQAGAYDRLIVYDKTDGRTRIYGWNNGGWKQFPHLTSAPEHPLRPNQSFWYQRKDATAGTWSPMP